MGEVSFQSLKNYTVQHFFLSCRPEKYGDSEEYGNQTTLPNHGAPTATSLTINSS